MAHRYFRSLPFTLLFFLFLSLGSTGIHARPSSAESFSLPASDEAVPGEGPLRRTEWFQNVWRERRSAFARSAEQDQGAVVFLGDSITQGWGGGLGAAFPGVQVANRGISGDTSRGVLLRLEEDVLRLNPQAVILLIGTNDLADGAEPQVIARNVERIIDALKTHNDAMPIVLCQVFPSSSARERPADDIQELNRLYLEAVRGDEQVIYLETWQMYADGDDDAPIELFPDLLHLNERGYAKWAAALRPLLATFGFIETRPDSFCPEAGFESLFNGKDLTGWGYRPTSEEDREIARAWQARDPNAAEWPFLEDSTSFDGMTESPDGRFRAINGRLVVTTPARYRLVQQLWTHREFEGDFVLKLEFRATPYTDSGVYLKGPQLQCRDYLIAGPYNDLKKYKPQDWNEMIVTVRDGVAHCRVNGEVIEEAFEVPPSGPIGLEGDRGQMEYRHIRIKQL